jgi:hypothetical protein
MAANTKNDHEKANEFMLAEYTLLKDFRDSALRQIDSRLNFYFTSVSGVITALALIYQFTGQNEVILLVSAVLLSLLFLLGLMTFNRILQGHISVTRYTRGINLIRKYFVSQNRQVSEYISNPISGDEPGFGNMGFVMGGDTPKINKIGLTAMTMLLDSFVVALILLFILRLAGQSSLIVYIPAALIAFGLSLLAHDSYVKSAMQKAERSYETDQKKLTEAIKKL